LSSPLVIIYKTLILIKTWRPPLKTKLRPIEDEMINLMASNAQ
jgi:poly(A) polymerase Pap1